VKLPGSSRLLRTARALRDEASLENLLFSSTIPLDAPKRNMPPFDYLHKELKGKHMTLQRLWEEYKEVNPEGYQYSQFCLRYQTWAKSLDVALRRNYKAGEKLFVDYAGSTIPIHDPATGEVTPAYLFVATLGRATTATSKPSSPASSPRGSGPTSMPSSTWARCPRS
jgi:transposase